MDFGAFFTLSELQKFGSENGILTSSATAAGCFAELQEATGGTGAELYELITGMSPEESPHINTPAPEKQATKPAPVTVQAPPVVVPPEGSGDLARMLATALQPYVLPAAAPLDKEAVTALIKSELSNRPTDILEIKQPDKAAVKITGAHSALKTVLPVLTALKQCFVFGPTGTGKTTLAAQCAEALNLPFGALSCSAGIYEQQLIGYADANGKFNTRHFLELYENGGVFSIDEVDAAEAGVLLVINSGISNGFIPVPDRIAAPIARRHKDFYLVCSGNTAGHGATGKYSARQPLDAAFLARFELSTFEINYDENYEYNLLCDFEGGKVASARFHRLRADLETAGARETVSSRVFKDAAALASAGFKFSDIFNLFVQKLPDNLKSIAGNY